MDVRKEALGGISARTILDVATGEGTFIATLAEHLAGYAQIVGVDTLGYTEDARDTFATENIHFAQMDAARLGFPEGSFDAVSVSSSLHHLEDLPRCMAEMLRVLEPGGHLIIRETHGDTLAPAQLTDVYLHRWVADIDAALGSTHNPVFARRELVALVEELGLANVAFYDIANTDSDPLDEAVIRESEEAIDRYLRYAQGLPGYQAFKERGEELRRRLREVGIQWEPELIIVGRKPCRGDPPRPPMVG